MIVTDTTSTNDNDTNNNNKNSKNFNLPRASSASYLLSESSSTQNIKIKYTNTNQNNSNGDSLLKLYKILSQKQQIKFFIFIFLFIISFEFGYYTKKCQHRKTPTTIGTIDVTNADGLLNLNHTYIKIVLNNDNTDIKNNNNFVRLVDFETNISSTEYLIERKIEEHMLNINNMFKSIKQAHNSLHGLLNLSIEYCDAVPSKLEGPLDLDKMFENNTLATLIDFYENVNKKSYLPKLPLRLLNIQSTNLNALDDPKYNLYGNNVGLGGVWRPLKCKSRHNLGVIVPYRDRFVHLAVLLRHLHYVLQRQLISYRIFVTEQYGNLSTAFNKGRIMNAAFIEALKIDPTIECFVFHDVDLVPEDDRNIYSCPTSPRHMSVAIDKFKYKLPYKDLVGGVFILRKEHYIQVNGYSNSYWGWGGEDDDMYERIASNKLILDRPSSQFARYRMIKHEGSKLNPERHKMLKTAVKRYKNDGVNTIQYVLVNVTLHHGFTHFLFDISDKS